MASNNRILIVDDNEAIHQDIKTILSETGGPNDSEIASLEQDLFEDQSPAPATLVDIEYVMDDAYQGEEAVNMVKQAAAAGEPYSVVFMDVRMPPGMDGIQTIKEIWREQLDTEIVVCTAYSDYSWGQILAELGVTDKLVFLRKPFDPIAIQQLALSLATKWQWRADAQYYIQNLEREVESRTNALNKTIADLLSSNQDAQRTIEQLQRQQKQTSES